MPPTAITPLLEVDIHANGEDFLSLREARVVDDKKRIARVTLVTVGPGNKVDKNYYTQSAIDSAPPLMEGSKCYADHPSKLDAQIQPERKSRDIIGWFSDVKTEGEKVTADLHVLNSEDKTWAWDLIKECITYAGAYAGRNLAGLSINARGNFKPMTLESEQWKGVTQFTDVKSVDLVTQPARGGQFETIVAESEQLANGDDTIKDNVRRLVRSGYDEKQALSIAMQHAGRLTEADKEGDEAGKIFQAVKEQVRALCSNGTTPGMEEVRRMIDKLGTALKLNKQEDGMDPKSQTPGQQPGVDLSDDALSAEAHRKQSEAYRSQAEACQDEAQKASFGKMAERHAQMAEKFTKAGEGEGALVIKHEEPGTPSTQSAEPPKEDKPKIEGEAKAEGKQSEGETKYINLLTSTLLKESGLAPAKQEYLKTVVLEGERDENKIRTKVKAYIQAELQESQRGTGHGFERVTSGGAARTTGGELGASASIQRLLHTAKGV
jgi:hypothetical protein